jgi:hypothetical protein
MADRDQARPSANPEDEQRAMEGRGGIDQGDGISGQGGNPGSGRGDSAVNRDDATDGGRARAAGAGSGESGREQTGDREGRGGYGNDTGFTGGTVGSRDEGER